MTSLPAILYFGFSPHLLVVLAFQPQVSAAFFQHSSYEDAHIVFLNALLGKALLQYFSGLATQWNQLGTSRNSYVQIVGTIRSDSPA